MISSLIKQASCDQILADVGYFSAGIKQYFALKRSNSWTPIRKNMLQPLVDDMLLKRQRRRIETVFSQLIGLFDNERIRIYSLSGFQLRLEECLMDIKIKLSLPTKQ